MNLTTCWWASRRLDRYLDGDPSAALSHTDVRRVERHAATCRRCAADLAERRRLREALHGLDARRITDPTSLERLDAMAAQLRGPGPA